MECVEHIVPFVIFAVCVFILYLIIVGLIKLIKYLGSAGRDQKLMRMELGKLADEVQQIRQELKTSTEQKENTN